MFAASARTHSVIREPLLGEDCMSTLNCLRSMGMSYQIENKDGGTYVNITPAEEWNQPYGDLDCGNSGTTMRLLSGLVASRPLWVRLIGDESLSKRPMKRIADPLRLMGALVEGTTPPITIRGGDLRGIDYVSPVASAQIKSCVLLAGLRATGETSVTEPALSRDHTERMLTALGVPLEQDGLKVSLQGGAEWDGFEFRVPADISSAAFFMVLAALHPNSELTLRHVGVNPSRTGILDVFAQAGIPVTVRTLLEEMGEPVADFVIRGTGTGKPFEIGGDLVPRLIDEIPVLAVLATQLEGRTIIRDAKEMRVKETDRIEMVTKGLKAMGATIEATEDGMIIDGPTPLKATRIDAKGDHRIAMTFAVAASIATGKNVIKHAESIATSYPDFVKDMERVAIV